MFLMFFGFELLFYRFFMFFQSFWIFLFLLGRYIQELRKPGEGHDRRHCLFLCLVEAWEFVIGRSVLIHRKEHNE